MRAYVHSMCIAVIPGTSPRAKSFQSWCAHDSGNVSNSLCYIEFFKARFSWNSSLCSISLSLSSSRTSLKLRYLSSPQLRHSGTSRFFRAEIFWKATYVEQISLRGFNTSISQDVKVPSRRECRERELSIRSRQCQENESFSQTNFIFSIFSFSSLCLSKKKKGGNIGMRTFLLSFASIVHLF